MSDCTEPNRAACPRLCQDFCNKAEEAKATSNKKMKTKYTIQNQSCLLNPVTKNPITGSRVYDGDFVLGEWYDTGNEEAAPKIIKALNQYSELAALSEKMAYELCKATIGHPMNCQCEACKSLREFTEHRTK